MSPDSPAVVTAVLADDEPPARERLRALLEEHGGVRLLASCEDGLEAVNAIEVGEPDVVFLDIEMPGLTGLEVMETLGVDQAPAVVFVTAHDEHAIRAFDLHAVDYLLKPFDRDRFFRTVDRVISRIASAAPAGQLASAIAAVRGPYLRRIPIRARGRITIVDVDEIEFLQAEGNYVRIQTPGRKLPLIRETLTRLEKKLDPTRFLRVHRSSIIRVGAVKELEALFQGEYSITFHGGGSVRSSRRFRDVLHQALHLD
jgi:two-component system, LytTR family, response regulator